MLATDLFEHGTARRVIADKSSFTTLILYQLLLTHLFSINELVAHLPICGAHGLSIGAKIVDLEEIKSTELILKEISHEAVQSAFVLRVDIHLREDFVDGVDGIDGLRVRIRHAFDLDGVTAPVCIDSEQILEHVLREAVMKFRREKLCHFLALFFHENCVGVQFFAELGLALALSFNPMRFQSRLFHGLLSSGSACGPVPRSIAEICHGLKEACLIGAVLHATFQAFMRASSRES